MKRIRMVLVDDQRLFVENLKIVMEAKAADMDVVGIASNGQEAVELAGTLSPDLILMDVRMPVMDGVEATRIIRRRHPGIQIIMLTTFDDDRYVQHALQYGAVGYILKDIPPDELFSSLRAISCGAVLVSQPVMHRLIHPSRKNETERVGVAENKAEALELYRSLTDRDREMIQLIARAYSNKDIAGQLGIAEQTVKNYLSQIYNKLGVFRRTELMRMFRDFSRKDFLLEE